MLPLFPHSRNGWKADIAQSRRRGQCAAIQSETANLPKGRCYPLNPTASKAALAGANICIDLHLISSPGDLFDAYFWPPNANVSYERLYVGAGSVPTERAAEAGRRMETVVMPSLVKWVAGILAQDGNSPVRREQQRIDLNSAEWPH
jgi:hypothetical protein